LKVLLLEYITAGGLSDKPLADALLQEAALMRDALLSDFSEISGIEILTTYDVRLGPPQCCYEAIPVYATSNAMGIWQALLTACDAALVIAPETDGVLNQLTQMLAAANVRNLGSRSYAVEITSNKYHTYHALKNAQILTIPTYTASEFLQPEFFGHDSDLKDSFNHGCVVKPMDGSGCAETSYFAEAAVLQTWLGAHQPFVESARFMIQPYQVGTPASISMLCKEGVAWLLSCNQQIIEVATKEGAEIDEINAHHASIQYKGCVVNGLSLHHKDFTTLALKISAAFPELNGYVGVDVIIHNEEIYLVEINPRITTSYIALRESLKCNPAKLILDLALCTSSTFKLPENIAKDKVVIKLHE